MTARFAPRALVALSTIVGCRGAPAEPVNSRGTPLASASFAAAATTPERDAGAVWKSMTKRDVAALSRSFGNGAPLPLPVPPVAAPADVAKPPPGALAGPSGTHYLVLERGSGATVHNAWDGIDLRYTVWTRHGIAGTSRAFGSEDFVTYVSEEFPPEWAAALALLHEGDKARFWYTIGEKAEPYLADVTLLKVHPKPEPPPVPPDVRAPSGNAVRAADGTAYEVLGAGEGAKTPSPADQVELVVTAWTNAGARFYSSLGGPPLVLPMGQLPAGWREAMQRLASGGRARLWIPAEVGRLRLETRIPRWPVDGLAVVDVTLVATTRAPLPEGPAERGPG